MSHSSELGVKPLTQLLGAKENKSGFWLIHAEPVAEFQERRESQRYTGPIENESDISPEVLMFWAVQQVLEHDIEQLKIQLAEFEGKSMMDPESGEIVDTDEYMREYIEDYEE